MTVKAADTSGASAASVLRAARRVVVKVGSALLCDAEGAINRAWLNALARDLQAYRESFTPPAEDAKQKREIVIVTSGAIALGRGRLGLEGKLRLDEKQAASAAGQIALAESWQAAFSPLGVNTAQVLLTLEDNEARRRYLNARATLRTLLDLGATPVINENDTVATTEIRYGDNDRLAAHAAQLCGADLLIILSDVDGLYTGDPGSDSDARHIADVREITPEIEAMATGPNKVAGVGAGGMATKLAAAKIAGRAGCASIIASGREEAPLSAILGGARATLVRAATTKETARRRWVSGRLVEAGAIHIDAGAATALKGGASLLPAGITKVAGAFLRGDAVALHGPDGEKLGLGLSTFDAADLEKLKGKNSSAIETVLGFRRRAVVIERSDFVWMRTVE
ncbi:MAG: glutamate 5-kinase [Pseudomonadota bacterium]